MADQLKRCFVLCYDMRLLYHRHLLAKSPDGFSRGCSGGDDGGDD